MKAVDDGIGRIIGELRNDGRLADTYVIFTSDNGMLLDGIGQSRANQAVVLNYTGFLAKNWKYIAYSYGDVELYDLGIDPGEMRNLVWSKRHQNVLRRARAQAKRLPECAAAACRKPVRAPRAELPGRG